MMRESCFDVIERLFVLCFNVSLTGLSLSVTAGGAHVCGWNEVIA